MEMATFDEDISGHTMPFPLQHAECTYTAYGESVTVATVDLTFDEVPQVSHGRNIRLRARRACAFFLHF